MLLGFVSFKVEYFLILFLKARPKRSALPSIYIFLICIENFEKRGKNLITFLFYLKLLKMNESKINMQKKKTVYGFI